MAYVEKEKVIHIVNLVMTDESIRRKGKTIRKRLKELPGEDVEKVVRCKDCEFYKTYSDPLEGFYGQCLARECNIGENDFCSYGIRKEGAEE